MTTPRLGSILLEWSTVLASDLDAALADQAKLTPHKRLGEILVERGVVAPEDVQRALGRQWRLPFMEKIPPLWPDRALVTQFPLEFLKKHSLIPLQTPRGNHVVAVSDPLEVFAYDAVANRLPQGASRVLCVPAAIDDALGRCFYREGEAPDEAALDDLGSDRDLSFLSGSGETEDLLDVANRPPIIRLVNSILFQAVEARASDIHVEPYEKELKIRFRVDGVLHERQSLDRNYSSALVSRLKIMAHLNIAERRLPQDGRSRVRIGGHGIDLRVATIPTAGGERVVLRLLDKAGTKLSYEQLGLLPAAQARFRRLLELTHGIVLLTGPTGSGKTTTLYSALNELNKPMRNILTVEDPIEYDIPGVAQIQVQPKIGLTFAGALRHMLRQDPDIMMVGEIRDLETAEIAIQAALTGHLVLSTLHTNDSAAAVTRLLDMGVEPFLVSSAVVGIMAQRLVRCICPKCGTSEAAGSDAIAVFLQAGLRLPNGTRLPIPRGCAHCSNTGYRGRKAISELLLVDDRIRQTIMDHGTANTLRDAATARGMETLRMDGLKKVLAGETTVAEVIRVTQGELLQYE